MSELSPGLYEVLVTEELRSMLERLPAGLTPDEKALRAAEAPDRVAWHISKQVEAALAGVGDERRVEVAVEVARALINQLAELVGVDAAAAPIAPPTVLHGLLPRLPDGSPYRFDEPLIPLLDTALLTNAPGEPNMWRQLKSEIDSAQSIDVLMAFIRRSGMTPLLDSLRRHCERGGTLRVLTTTFTGSTEGRALDELRALGADVRISYDLSTTRLHAKAWIFERDSGFSTAYIGSSNLTHTAQSAGLEWNVRVSHARNPDVLQKFVAAFTSYWNSDNFVAYDPEQFDAEHERAVGADRGPRVILSPIELSPQPFQSRLLEQLAVARQRGRHRNLLVSATGTGKTVMAALDYATLREVLPRARLLFLAHRREILDQSLATFRYALRDPSFGEKWVSGARPTRFDHVFASIQSLDAAEADALPADHFDVVVVDEFHHAAASSYRRVLERLEPVELLGLTATPERSDGLPILDWFDGRIAAELRLWDAIDQQHLTPFLYYGIHDGIDLQSVPWRRGVGYDVDALTAAYTGSEDWARLVIQQVDEHADTASMRALGFCVSIQHAEFMAAMFSRHGVEAVAISGDSALKDRDRALVDLASGQVRVVFSVDLFNEGVDVPAVDTVLMLRPTESPTLFVQQLGRGLRKAKGKSACTVLDFVGTHRKEFRFDRRFRALLGGSRRDVEVAIQDGFPFLPAGCNMQLDQQAQEVVLRSLKEAIPTRWPAKVDELRALRQNRPEVGLSEFLVESGLELEDVYEGRKSWSDLREAAGSSVAEAGPHEERMRAAVGRVLHIDDAERINTYRRALSDSVAPDLGQRSVREVRLLHMLAAQIGDQAMRKETSVQDAIDLLWSHPQVRAELAEVFEVLEGRIDHLHQPLVGHVDVPLQVHARYSRIEVLAAMGVPKAGKVASWQSGVFATPAADLFAFTLDKTSGSFSPTTRYRDYAISRRLIHWESQSTTRADSDTGRRYQNHEQLGHSILLFARLRAVDRAFWFLGPARYRGHVGERPMAITWELEHELSGDLFAAFAAAVG